MTLIPNLTYLMSYFISTFNPLLVIPKKFSAARGKNVRGLAQLIKYAFGCLQCGESYLL